MIGRHPAIDWARAPQFGCRVEHCAKFDWSVASETHFGRRVGSENFPAVEIHPANWRKAIVSKQRFAGLRQPSPCDVMIDDVNHSVIVIVKSLHFGRNGGSHKQSPLPCPLMFGNDKLIGKQTPVE